MASRNCSMFSTTFLSPVSSGGISILPAPEPKPKPPSSREEMKNDLRKLRDAFRMSYGHRVQAPQLAHILVESIDKLEFQALLNEVWNEV